MLKPTKESAIYGSVGGVQNRYFKVRREKAYAMLKGLRRTSLHTRVFVSKDAKASRVADSRGRRI